MDIKQDPNSIPNFGGGGRIGELSPNEPEQAQSSVELDPVDGGEDVPVGSGRDSLLDNGSSASVTPQTPQVRPQTQAQTEAQAPAQPQSPQAPAMAEAGGLPVDKSKTGEGSIDALVGAP
jgi:hypothetical protein